MLAATSNQVQISMLKMSDGNSRFSGGGAMILSRSQPRRMPSPLPSHLTRHRLLPIMIRLGAPCRVSNRTRPRKCRVSGGRLLQLLQLPDAHTTMIGFLVSGWLCKLHLARPPPSFIPPTASRPRIQVSVCQTTTRRSRQNGSSGSPPRSGMRGAGHGWMSRTG